MPNLIRLLNLNPTPQNTYIYCGRRIIATQLHEALFGSTDISTLDFNSIDDEKYIGLSVMVHPCRVSLAVNLRPDVESGRQGTIYRFRTITEFEEEVNTLRKYRERLL